MRPTYNGGLALRDATAGVVTLVCDEDSRAVDVEQVTWFCKTYAIEVGSAPEEVDAFMRRHAPGVPPYPYAVSSVEMGMFSAGIKSEAVAAGIDPQHPAVLGLIAGKLRGQKYTNYSGD